MTAIFGKLTAKTFLKRVREALGAKPDPSWLSAFPSGISRLRPPSRWTALISDRWKQLCLNGKLLRMPPHTTGFGDNQLISRVVGKLSRRDRAAVRKMLKAV